MTMLHFTTAVLASGVVASTTLADPSVGAFYYPWWSQTHPRGHSYADTHRAVLNPQGGDPIIGRYDSRDPWVIASHIDQSRAANISVWFSSWWGPGSFEDDALRAHILPHPHASRLKHAVLYETTGRLGDTDDPQWATLRSDLDYLARHYFTGDNYYTVDGKPAVFVYVSRAYMTDPAAADELAAARREVKGKHGMDLYLIGDHVFNQVALGADAFDAVSAYDVYGQTHRSAGGTYTGSAEALADIFAEAASQGNVEGFDLIPTVSPGYNDRQTRLEADNPAAPRYYEDRHTTSIGDPFRDQITVAALPHADADLDGLFLVNSFNEWHEDTQIEAISPSTATLRDITDGNVYTQLKYYEGYGTRYLDLLRRHTGGPEAYPIFNGLVGDVDQNGTLDLDDLEALGHHWMLDSADLTLREIAMHGDWDLGGRTDVQDMALLVGYLNAEGFDLTLEQALAIVPEPGCLSLGGAVGLIALRRRR
jgi:hypothetical protein